MTTKLDLALASGKRDIILILLETYQNKIIQQFYSDSFLFTALKHSKQVIKQTGGEKIKQQLELGNTDNVGVFGRGDTKAPSYVDSLSEAEVPWRYYYASILELFVDKQQASSGKATLDKLAKDIRGKTTAMQDLLNEHCYAGMGYSRGPIGGCQALIADNPIRSGLPSQLGGYTSDGRVCGIPQDDLTHSYWRNIALDFNGSNDYRDAYYNVGATGAEAITKTGVDGTGYLAGKIGTQDYKVDPMTELSWDKPADWNASTGSVQKRGMADYLEDGMEWMLKSCCMGKESMKNDILIITSKSIHSKFKKTQLSYVNFANTVTSFGFKADLDYEGVPIVWTPACPEGHMYFINMSNLHMVYDPRYFFNYSNMAELSGSIKDKGMFIVTIMNLILSRRNNHGVIYNLQAWETTSGF